MKKGLLISSTALFAVVILAGCLGPADEQAANDAAKKTEAAQEAVVNANDNFAQEKVSVAEAEMDAKKDVLEATGDAMGDVADGHDATEAMGDVKEAVGDAAGDVMDAKKDAVESVTKQDQKALEAVAEAAGAKFTVAALEVIKTDAAKSVGPAAVATSIDNTSKNDAVFVVDVTSVQGISYEVYVDATGKVVQTDTK